MGINKPHRHPLDASAFTYVRSVEQGTDKGENEGVLHSPTLAIHQLLELMPDLGP